MRKFKWILALFAVVVIGYTWARLHPPHPTDDDLNKEFIRQLIQQVLDDRDIRELPIDVKFQRGLGSPMQNMGGGSDSRCTLLVDMDGMAELTTLTHGPKEYAAFVQAAVVHEATHCLHSITGRNDHLALVTHLAKTTQDPTLVAVALEEGRIEEAAGDVAALVWARSRHPATYPAVVAAFVAMRSPGATTPSHNTLPILREVLSGDKMFTMTNIFKRADNLMMPYDPNLSE